MSVVRRFGFFALPSVLLPMLSFLMLPLYTRILGPVEYGTFALVTSLSSFGSSATGSGISFMLSAHYPQGTQKERSELLSGLLWMSLGLGLLLCPILGAGWWAASHFSAEVRAIPAACVAFALSSMIVSIPWTLAYQKIILDGQARAYAIISIISALLGTGAVLAALYVLHATEMALFIGMLVTSMATLLGSMYVLRNHLRISQGWQFANRFIRLSVVATPANLLESVQALVERAALTAYASLTNLGLFSHALQYRSALFTGAKALGNASWTTTLEEARDATGGFPRTYQIWQVLQLFLAAAVLAFAAFGESLLTWLTHGKFSQASLIATALLATLLVQFSGRPQIGILHTRNQGEFIAHLSGISALAGIIFLLLCVSYWGVWAAVGGIALRITLFRLGIEFRARTLAPVAFQDGIAACGLLLCAGMVVCGQMWALPTFVRILLFGGSIVLLALFGSSAMRFLIVRARTLVRSRLKR